MTRPTPKARITAPISTGGMYEGATSIQNRIAGSMES